jgi:hypothetical protein
MQGDDINEFGTRLELSRSRPQIPPFVALKIELTFEPCTTSALTCFFKSESQGLMPCKKKRGEKEMMTKLMLAVMVSAAVMLGGAGVAAAAGGTASGDCDQTQDQTRLQQRDGSCDGSNCQEHDYDWNYDWNYDYGDSE